MIAVYPGTVESIQVRVDHDCRYRSTGQVRSKIGNVLLLVESKRVG
jgi:hypothetical protein